MAVLWREDHNGFLRGIEVYNLLPLIDQIRDRLTDEALLVPNAMGNLSILSPAGKQPDLSPSPNGIGLWFVGWIDVTIGEIFWARDEEQSPFDGEFASVDGSGSPRNTPWTYPLRPSL